MFNFAQLLMVSAVLLFSLSCSRLSPEDELQTLLSETHPHTQVQLRNGFKIKATYLPLRYFELRELTQLPDSLRSEEKVKAIQQKTEEYYGNGIYFIVTLSTESNEQDILNATSKHFGEWSQNLQKFLFKMTDYIYLETKQHKEIRLSVYDFQRTFGYTKDRSMILCFPKTFNDKAILSEESGFLKMHFKEWGWNTGRQSVKWDIGQLVMNNE